MANRATYFITLPNLHGDKHRVYVATGINLYGQNYWSIYQSGVFVRSLTSGGSVLFDRIGWGYGLNSNADVSYLGLYNRVLSPFEIATVSNDPFIQFRPSSSLIDLAIPEPYEFIASGGINSSGSAEVLYGVAATGNGLVSVSGSTSGILSVLIITSGDGSVSISGSSVACFVVRYVHIEETKIESGNDLQTLNNDLQRVQNISSSIDGNSGFSDFTTKIEGQDKSKLLNLLFTLEKEHVGESGDSGALSEKEQVDTSNNSLNDLSKKLNRIRSMSSESRCR